MKVTRTSFAQVACLLLPLSPLALSSPLRTSRRLIPRRIYETNGPLASNTSTPQAPQVGAARPAAAAAPAAEADSPVPVGTIISSCTVPGTVALTFDDGPYIYTPSILDTLQSNGVTATFFVNGVNWADINSADSQASVRRMVDEGHQIGSHTYTHADLATLDRDGIANQMTQLEAAVSGIIGVAPRYMRPPYLSTNALVLQTLGELQYHVIQVDIDTLDYSHDAEDQIQESVQIFKDGLAAGGTIELSHDVHQWTAEVLVQAMIDEVKARGLRAVPVGECLGDPKENWYKTL